MKRHHETSSSNTKYTPTTQSSLIDICSKSKDAVLTSKNRNDPNSRSKPRVINTGTSHYKPIAPAPCNKVTNNHKSMDFVNSSIVSSPNTTVMLPPSLPSNIQQHISPYLTQGADGTMYLITNPLPTITSQPPPLLISSQSGVLQLVQQPQYQQPFLIGNSQNIPNYIQAPIFSPVIQQQFPSVMHMNTLQNNPTSSMAIPSYGTGIVQSVMHPTAPKQEVSKSGCHTNINLNAETNSGLDTSNSPTHVIPKSESMQEDTSQSLDTSKDEGPKIEKKSPPWQCKETMHTVIREKKITFDSGSFNENTVTYQNEKGQKIKLDILERAMLAIPELS